MIDVPFAYALVLGMVAVVNPCGFPMLPAYLSSFIGLDDADADPGMARVPRAIGAATAVSIWFVGFFGVVGIPIHAGLTSIYRVMPWLTIAIGLALVVLGVAMLAGYRLKLLLPRLDKGGRTGRFGSMVVFGVSYAVASLGCTLPLFLSVIANRSNAGSGALAFVAYGLGMSLVLMVLTLALALAREAFVRRLRAALRHVDRVAGGLLVLVGAYLVWYWASALAKDPSDTIGSSPLRVVDDWAYWAAGQISGRGAGLGAALAVVVVATTAWTALRRSPSS